MVVTQGIASVDADAGALQLLTDDAKMLEVVYGQGSDSALIDDQWRRFSIDLKLPSTDALHRLEPLFIESEKDIRENYPRRTIRMCRSGPAYTRGPALTSLSSCPGGRSECSSLASLDREGSRSRNARSYSHSAANARRH